MADLKANYDEVPYPTHARAATQPERLAVVARLAGLETKAVDRCRVLELGCGDGENIIALAVQYPGSTFIGVDLAPRPVERGQAVIAELGLANVTLQVGDIAKLRKDLGEFDYVFAHGVYSWVPDPVKDALLAACREHLAEKGVAFVSYNAMPGGHIKRLVREMMLFHVRHVSEPMERVEEARALIGFLMGVPADATVPDAFRALMLEEAQRLINRSEADVFHDDLATINDPIYVVEFLQHASQHGLQFLGEAEYFMTRDDGFPEEIRAALRPLGEQSRALREQYLDFIRCRQFRQTLLCRREVELDFDAAERGVTSLYVLSDAPGQEPEEDGHQTFASPARGSVRTNSPLGKAAFSAAAEAYPRALPFGTLAARALERSGETVSAFKASQRVAKIISDAYGSGFVDLLTQPPHVVEQVAERPVASPLARLQARRGDSSVTTLRHSDVALAEDIGRAFIQLLDGTRDREALLDALAPLREGVARDALRAEMERKLEELARAGVLRE